MRRPRHPSEGLQLRAIREILRATAEALPLDEILAVIVNIVIIVGDASTAWFMLMEQGCLRTAVARGELADRLVQMNYAVRPDDNTATVLGTSPLILSPERIDPTDPLVGPFAGSRASVVLIPVRRAHQADGLLGCAVSSVRSTDISFLVTISGQAATAIENAHLREERRIWRERLSAVFEQMAEAVLVFDREGRITLMNPAAVDVFGPKGVRLGDTIAEAILKAAPRGPDGRLLALGDTAATRALRGEHVSDLEESIPTAEGARRYSLVSSAPLIVNGQIQGAAVVWREITRLKQAEEERFQSFRQVEAERAWLRAVIERSPVGIILVEGANGERVVANWRAEEMFGRPLPPEGGISQYVGQIYAPDRTPLTRDKLATERALHGVSATVEEELLRQPSGREVRARVSSAPIRENGRIVGAVIVYEDITQIRDLEQQREEWTSAIAHDLRQPVTIINGYADMLVRQMARQPGSPERRAAEHISTSARNLNKMISDLLDISRIVAGQLVLERRPCDLVWLIRAVVERATGITGDHRVSVTVEGDIPVLEVDPGRVEQVLDNLLANAARYGYPETDIRVELARRDGEVVVSVANQGEGIAPADMPRLFERFYRGPRARAQRKEGLGLGLYISKGLVEAHGGRIWAESIPGRTTTVSFALPVPSHGEGRRFDDGAGAPPGPT